VTLADRFLPERGGLWLRMRVRIGAAAIERDARTGQRTLDQLLGMPTCTAPRLAPPERTNAT
jgi:hypothetical protein